MSNKSPNGIVVVLLVVLAAIAGYAFFNMRDNRTGAERVGDAVSALPNGIDKAARELENRTSAERVGDAVGDAVERRTSGSPHPPEALSEPGDSGLASCLCPGRWRHRLGMPYLLSVSLDGTGAGEGTYGVQGVGDGHAPPCRLVRIGFLRPVLGFHIRGKVSRDQIPVIVIQQVDDVAEAVWLAERGEGAGVNQADRLFKTLVATDNRDRIVAAL